MSRHYRIQGAQRRERARVIEGLNLPPVLAVVDAHRRLRGPYTGAGAMMHAIAEDALSRRRELGLAHSIEITTCAPELAGRVPPSRTSLEWKVAAAERTRFYSRLHTFNIANGLAQLLRDYLQALDGPRTLVVENIHQADPTDREFVAVLLRRTDLPQLTLVVGTGLDPIPDPAGPLAISLEQCLGANAVVFAAPRVCEPELGGADGDSPGVLAKIYVEGDGISDEPRLIVAYDSIPAADRAALHDARHNALVAEGHPSLRLGAIPYHAERGSDPQRAGAAAIRDALHQCKTLGLYQAAVDLGVRGRTIVNRSEQPDLWLHFTEATATSLASLGRASEAESLYGEAQAATQDPEKHMGLAYGIAMLYARHYSDDKRDDQQARAWLNLSLAIARLLEDPKKRTFHTVFAGNGLALIEVRQGNSDEALRLLEEGIARFDAELESDQHRLHRLVLRYNRTQVFITLGRLEQALQDYAAVIEIDPDFPEHHFNVGNILRRLGRNDEAIAAYERALRRSPPFPEAYYNRADARLELGDLRGALTDFEYTIELDPGRVDAHVNLAALRCELGNDDEALRAIATGLAVAPGHAALLCMQARLLAGQGHTDRAELVLSQALEQDGGLPEAWALRGELAYSAGDLTGATAALDRAVALADRPAIRFNRAVVLQAAGRYADAASDYKAVLATITDPDAEQRLSECLNMTVAVPRGS